ncbi:MAG: hypothetical protein M1837_004453 [Sclerophora amabilis]|nr:MAG: hypothetical protein M1837_004453 [Sclerophora amabilis]
MASRSTLGGYTKIVALTQGALNHAFQMLHEIQSRLVEFKFPFKDDFQGNKEEWDIRLKFLPFQIAIKSAEEVFLIIRIQEGEVKYGERGAARAINLMGWTLAQAVDPARLLQPREGLKEFDASIVRGDLSSERILAILLAACSDGIEPHATLSSCGMDGNHLEPVSWQEWSANHVEDAKSLVEVFQKWPMMLKELGYNFLGLKFNLPPMLQEGSDSLEIGNGIEDRKLLIYSALSGATNSKAQVEDYNSVLICRGNSAQGSSTSFSEADFAGDFVAESHASGADLLTGLWTVRCGDFLEQTVLPQLGILNQATELDVRKPEWLTENEVQKYKPMYKVRTDFVSAVDSLDVLPAYGFVPSESTSGPNPYRWRSTSGPMTETMSLAKKELNRRSRYTTSVDHFGDVTFEPGEEGVRAHFDTVYKVQSQWLKLDSDKALGHFRYVLIKARLLYKLPIDYSFDSHFPWFVVLKVYTTEGVLSLKVHEMPTGSEPAEFAIIEGPDSKGFKELYEGRHLRELKSFSKDIFRPSVLAACWRFKANFEASLTWSIPERKWFEFKKPIWNQMGDLVIGVEYKPSSIQDLFSVADLSSTRSRPTRPQTTEDTPVIDTTKLKWSCSSTFNSNRSRIVVKVRALNDSGDSIPAGYIEVIFQSARKGDFLFSAFRFQKGTDTVKVLGPEKAEVKVEKMIGHDGNTFRATLLFDALLASCAAELVIDSSSAATGGPYPLQVAESWKDADDESNLIGGKGVLLVDVR